jgi:hypothetical protein
MLAAAGFKPMSDCLPFGFSCFNPALVGAGRGIVAQKRGSGQVEPRKRTS